MEYTKEQINFIQSRKPEFIPKPIPSLDAVIVEFLLKYEVYVTPPKNSKAKDGGITGAVAGSLLAGPDLAGDALLIRGQKQQTNIQEWTQWKQWALDHKDFPKFQTEFFNEVHTHNENIDKTLKDPDFQKEIKFFMTKRARTVKITMYSLLAFLLLIIGIPIIFNEFGYPKWYSDSFKLSRRFKS